MINYTPPPIIIQHDLSKESRCGGGYTDKNGIQWNWYGTYPNCKYYPSIDLRILREYKDNKFWIKNDLDAPPKGEQWEIEKWPQ